MKSIYSHVYYEFKTNFDSFMNIPNFTRQKSLQLKLNLLSDSIYFRKLYGVCGLQQFSRSKILH